MLLTHADTCLYVLLSQSGKVLRQWGSDDFWLPHSITVDRNNSVWVVDAGRHQVFKFTASGKLLMTLGKRDRPGDKKTQFCKPTQVLAQRCSSAANGNGCSSEWFPSHSANAMVTLSLLQEAVITGACC